MPVTSVPYPARRIAPQPHMPEIGLARIFAAFLLLGSTSFGGGTAGWLYRDIVLKRRWVDDQAFLAMMAVGQVMPGANGVKMTVLIGHGLRGAGGAAVALSGLLAGPFAIVLAIGAVYAGFGGHPIVHHMLDGVAAAVVGLTLATGLRSVAHGATGPPPDDRPWRAVPKIAVAAATVVGVGVLRWPILPVIAILAPVSIGLALVEARRR